MYEEGFFSELELQQTRVTLDLVPLCGKCGLYKEAIHPYMKVAGKGKKEVMVVGEAPGANEDKKGIPFIGEAGQRLQNALNGIGVDLFKDCWVTNALICRPKDNVIEDKNAVSYCRANVVQAIRTYNPKVVILLGAKAVESVIGWLWREKPGGIGRWAGFQIPSQKINAWVCPTYHPSFVIRQEKDRKDRVTDLFFRKHLKAAFSLNKRPWKKIPDLSSKVDVITKDKEGAERIEALTDKGVLTSFDYETDRLKPQHPDSRIVCVGISDGLETISCVWGEKVHKAMDRYLLSKHPKVGASMGFEENWTWKHFGHGVNNWVGDVVLNAHILDHRKEVTSVKFNAFALLGQDAYDSDIKKYLESEGDSGNSPNKIHLIPLSKLLLYCGMDALLEYTIHKIQQRRFRNGS